ncbi:MAG: thioredoxin family protein [Chitinophagales bacterium]|nr:thioredoxin family protein [Chitinophagales bacterium]
MKYLFVLVVTLFCSQIKSQTIDTLRGKVDAKELSETGDWFQKGYNEYSVSPNISLVKADFKGVKVIVIMGTWCSDSRREVPHFIKMLYEYGVSTRKVDIQSVDKSKKTGLEKYDQYKIEYVPTFIFIKKGKEIGRIIETPNKSLEEDTKEILVVR